MPSLCSLVAGRAIAYASDDQLVRRGRTEHVRTEYQRIPGGVHAALR